MIRVSKLDCCLEGRRLFFSESLKIPSVSTPTVVRSKWCGCPADTDDTMCQRSSQCQMSNQRQHIQHPQTSAIAACQHQDNKSSSKTKSSSCEPTTQTTTLSGTSEAPSTGTAKTFCPFYDEHVKEVSDRLWLPTLTDCAGQHSHWCAGSFKNTESNSWFTIQKWTHQKSNSQTSSWQHSPCLSADFMAAARIKIGLTEEEMGEEEKAKRREAAARRAAEKATKAEEKKKRAEERASKPSNRTRKKTPAQLQKEAAKEAKRLEKERVQAENAAKKAAREAEKAQRPPPTLEQLEARRRAVEKKAAKKARAANSSRRVRLRPTPHMRRVLKMWMGCFRVTYNRALELSQKSEPPNSYNYAGFIRAAVCNEENIGEEWLKNFPSACRKLAAKDMCDAYWSNQAKVTKTGGTHKFQMRFKSKKDQNQTLKVESAHVTLDGNKMHICQRKAAEEIKRICREAGQVYDERMLNMWFDPQNLGSPTIDKDVVITMDKLGRFWMHCPYRREGSPKNQRRPPRWTALDPGHRVFLTGYDPSGDAFKLGVRASDRIIRLCKRLDSLVSQTDSLSQKIKRKRKKDKRNAKRSRRLDAARIKKIRQKVMRMKRAQHRMRDRVRNLVAELHWKCANWLCERFTDIILPPFATSEMVCKKNGRHLNSKVARAMMTMSHYTFRQRLIHVASMKGCVVHVRPEDYTSKTCTNCGYIHDELGSKDVFRCPRCHLSSCRDAAASRNIFLKNVTVEFEPCFHEHGAAR